jgi:hypothetical protein
MTNLNPMRFFTILFFLTVLFNFSTRVQAQVSQNTSNGNFSIQLVQKGASTIAQVSLNGKQGHSGELKIYNAQHVLLKTCGLELIPTPYYASVDVSTLQPNQNYTFELISDDGVTTVLTIQL